MKKLLLLFFISVLINTSYAQVWLNKLPENKSSKQLSFYDYQKAFYDYWKPYNVKRGYYYINGNKVKAHGWKQFKRWEWDMEGQIDKQTGFLPDKSAQEIYEEYKLQRQHLKNTTAANWVSLGCSSSNGGYAGIGRINCIAFHPTDNNTYWVGAPAGGLWLTTDNGNSWTCLTDDNAVLGVSDIVVPSDYSTSNTIYIATGDRDSWDNRSVGVLKSTDGGSSWNATGLNFTLANAELIYRLLISPDDNSVLIAATSDGVYKTSDAGVNWTQLSTDKFIDMEYKPGDFSTLYASTKHGTIYKSSNGGSSWTKVLDESDAKRIELAVTPANSSLVYAVASNADAGLFGVFKSTDSGSSFQKITGDILNILGYDANGLGRDGQAWYDLVIAASPSDEKVVLVGGINTWRSKDGGNSWNIINHWWGDGVQAVHADKHGLKFRSNGDLFETNDGGVYFSADTGNFWIDKTNGMVISEIYRLGVSQTEPNAVITGLQDNGSKLLNTDNKWHDVKGGDGMECIIDYVDYNTQYATYINGQIDRTVDAWNTSIDISKNIGDGTLEGAWVTPYIIDPEDHNTLYVGYEEVWKTTDKGNSFTKISSFNSGNKLRSMAIAPSDNHVLYVADYDVIRKTDDGGETWSDITGDLPVNNSSIRYIAVRNDDPNTLWVAMSGYNRYKVYESTDGGNSWTNISAGLPEIPVYSIVQNKQSDQEIHLYAGTELGVYYKKGNADWVEYNSGLPNVKIGELEIYYDNNDFSKSKLRAATFGRALWETYLEPANSNGLIFEKAATGEDGSTVEISFNLSIANPAGEQAAFTVNNGADIQPDSVSLKAGDNHSIVLYLPTKISVGQDVTVSYTQGNVASGNGILLSNFVDKYVANRVKNTTGFVQLSKDSENDILVYPNPNKGEFTLKFGHEISGKIHVKLYDMQGKQVLSKRINHAMANEELLIQLKNKKGIFNLVIETGNKHIQKSILIQ